MKHSQGLTDYLDIKKDSEGVRISLPATFNRAVVEDVWSAFFSYISDENPRRIVIDAGGLSDSDGTAITFLVSIKEEQERRGNTFQLNGLSPRLLSLYTALTTTRDTSVQPKSHETYTVIERTGLVMMSYMRSFYDSIIFVGELTWQLCYAAAHPRRVRWKDVGMIMERAGVDAVCIVALIGFLMGLIMAFQAAIPMRQFGADIFVADLVALSLLRELGPLMTAIVLAGRTGSAFAAELGTMKVNEEISALKTMGLDPVQFLVISRVVGVVAITPLLTLCAHFAGLIGGGVVVRSLGYPVVTYVNQIMQAVHMNDFFGGMVKAFVFGFLIAATGCRQGITTGIGSQAVGDSATRAVVSSILLIVVADGLFSIVYYFIGI